MKTNIVILSGMLACTSIAGAQHGPTTPAAPSGAGQHEHGSGQPEVVRMRMASARVDKIKLPKSGTELEMRDFGGRPVVDVLINGQGPFRFILDTGASVNVVDSALNKELNLPVAKDVLAAPPGHSHIEGAIVSRLDKVQIGEATLQGAVAVVMPLSSLLGARGPRGVLSAASFPGYLLSVNYPKRRIAIRKGKLRKADSATIFQYQQGDAFPTVPIRIAGRQTRVHVDSGSGSGLTLPLRFLKELSLTSEPTEVGKARTPGGEYPIFQAGVQGSVELGQYQLPAEGVTFSDVQPGGNSAGPQGQIGFEVLRKFVVTLDSKNRRIQFAE